MRIIERDVTVHPSVCPLDCADTCSLAVEVKNGLIHAVRGSSANPFTGGKICSKVAKGLPLQVHGPDRLTTPLQRSGPRGERAYKAIGWEQALDTIHERYQAIIARHGPQAIVPLSYGGPMGMLAGNSMDKRFFNRLGATQVDSSTLCAGVSGAAYDSVFGDVGGISFAELAHSKLIVVWGNNITVCNLHLTKMLREARKNGAKLVVIDPKRIRIAREADLHLPILPGTDVVLAYAVAAELDRQNALDDEFIARHVHGAERYLAEAKKYSLERAAPLCGLAVEDIQQLVAYWRDISPAAISIGVAVERNRNGGAGIRAAFALPALTGNFGSPGAGVCDVSGFFSVDKKALQHPELVPPGTREISVLDIPHKILQPGDDIPIEGVFIYNHNPIAVHPKQRDMQRALMSDDVFVVGSDITMTDSMACADIILPAASHLEYGDLYKAYGHHYLQRSEPVISPVGDSLPNTELFRRLAARFGFTDSCFSQDDNDLIELAMAPGELPDGHLSALEVATHGALDMSIGNTKSLLRGAQPATASGKIELYSDTLEREYGQGLPQFRQLASNRRFILISPSSEKRTNSTFGGVEGHDSDLMVEMNSGDAQSLALHAGELVRIYNDLGEVILPLEISSNVRPSTIYVPKGAWLKGSKTGQTINALIPGHRADIAGGACYNDTMVDVEPATF